MFFGEGGRWAECFVFKRVDWRARECFKQMMVGECFVFKRVDWRARECFKQMI